MVLYKWFEGFFQSNRCLFGNEKVPGTFLGMKPTTLQGLVLWKAFIAKRSPVVLKKQIGAKTINTDSDLPFEISEPRLKCKAKNGQAMSPQKLHQKTKRTPVVLPDWHQLLNKSATFPSGLEHSTPYCRHQGEWKAAAVALSFMVFGWISCGF